MVVSHDEEGNTHYGSSDRILDAHILDAQCPHRIPWPNCLRTNPLDRSRPRSTKDHAIVLCSFCRNCENKMESHNGLCSRVFRMACDKWGCEYTTLAGQTRGGWQAGERKFGGRIERIGYVGRWSEMRDTHGRPSFKAAQAPRTVDDRCGRNKTAIPIVRTCLRSLVWTRRFDDSKLSLAYRRVERAMSCVSCAPLPHQARQRLQLQRRTHGLTGRDGALVDDEGCYRPHWLLVW